MKPGIVLILALLGLGCRSPLTQVALRKGEPALGLTVDVEDHSRRLSHLWSATGEADSPAARRAALERHRQAFEAELRTEATSRGLRLDPAAPLQLHLTLTSLGEVRTKYIAWGILSGVAWGVGTGLLVHNTRLAVGLGLYEFVEESAFWIGGSMLMGRWSSPAVVEARLCSPGSDKPLWEETYHVLWARRELAALPREEQGRREQQLQASLRKIRSNLFEDLERIPDFPHGRTTPAPTSALAPTLASGATP
ncbi:hypothetical protein GETHLI_20960 [Geothrix limicola]|uniref:Uncharacterized protein n=1 Tax=Geothrix limicola TaxID=2927978 RepID=A0ABQ5QG71_9BACT|nr:hypothetical protein [Geothrix limicola]GLH73594.1 hypothetical protein GETHLI_20960 [Geothrix limicola]